MCRFRLEQYTPPIGTIFLFCALSPGNGPILLFRFGAITARSIYEIDIYIFNYGAKHTYFLRSQNVEFGLEITGAAGAIFRLSPFGNPIKYRFYRDKVFRSLEILDLSEKS